MRHAALFAGAAVMSTALLTHTAVRGQEPAPASAFIAFRVDSTRVIATVKVTSALQQLTDGLSPQPAAQFGYRYFDPPAFWLAGRDKGAADARPGDRWVIEAAPGRTFEAETERVVGGQPGC